jgi:hypothetical protein
VAGASVLVSLPDGARCTIRFLGFFGVVAAADVSEPDFLSFTVAVDFLPVSLPFESSRSVALSVPLVPESAASSPDVDGDDDGELASESDEDEPEDDDDESDDESEDDESEDDELEESVSDGPAKATPGVVATAIPTPNATAKPPTRPTYLA